MVMELLEGQTVHAKLRHSGRFAAEGRVRRDVAGRRRGALHPQPSDPPRRHQDREHLPRAARPAQRRLVKLLDFGLVARRTSAAPTALDGTPEYLAPERIDGAPASQASDIYALGIVFFELLTGKLPFTGDLEDVFRQHREGHARAPSAHCDGDAARRARRRT